MCTLSWRRGPAGGYMVFFNRDERRTRPAADAPTLRPAGAVRALYPVDPEGGGTWLGVNALGVTLALANRYDVTVPRGPRASRGRLVAACLEVAGIAALRERLARADLAPFAGFTLVAFAPGDPPWAMAWDGSRRASRAIRDEGLILTSSALDAAAVSASRRRVFADPDALAHLPSLHAGHVPVRGAASVCMHRPDAATVSYSEVEVTATCASFRYQPGAPCEGRPASVARLARPRAA